MYLNKMVIIKHKLNEINSCLSDLHKLNFTALLSIKSAWHFCILHSTCIYLQWHITLYAYITIHFNELILKKMLEF